MRAQKRKRWCCHLNGCGAKQIWEILAFTGRFDPDTLRKGLRSGGQNRDLEDEARVASKSERRRLQHAKAEAADFEVIGTDNAELFDWIKSNLEPDQLILEFYTPGEPNSGWIHCSWIPEGRRASFLHAYKFEGKTKYKPILGSAKDLV